MPFARIDLIAGKPEDYRRTIGDVVYHAMVDILKAVPVWKAPAIEDGG
jgi:hypothetical protein